MHQQSKQTVCSAPRALGVLALAAATLAALAASQAQAARLGGAFRAAAAPVVAPPMVRSGAVGGYNGVRAMPHFNTTTAAGPFAPSVKGRFNTASGAMPASAMPRPPNMGFAQGQGRMQTHTKGTTVLRYGGKHSRYVTPDLQARPPQLALPPGAATPPRHYYRLTQDIIAPTGGIAKAYGQPGGATQIVLNQEIRESPMVRTITPNFASAALGGMR